MSTVECLGILPKKQGETLVLGFGLEQRLQQQSTPACFVGHGVVWWFIEMFVFFLSSHLSLFPPGCEQLHTIQLQYSR